MTVTAPAALRLYPFQERMVAETRAALAEHGSAVLVLPTGGGKTIVAADIAQRAVARGSPVLMLVHRRELVRQAVDTLSEAVPHVEIGVEAAGWASKPWAPLQVASIQSLARRDRFVRPFRVVVVDECHHCRAPTWAKVLERWPDAWRIGLTATPERLDGKGLREHFETMVVGPNIRELVAEGYLAPTRTLTIPSGLRPEAMRLTRNGDVRGDDQEAQVTPKVVAAAADAYLRYTPGRRAIFFGIHRQHSRDVCSELRDRGVRAEHVDGDDTVARRDRIMRSFKTGGIDVVGNCDLISEGFDAPACEVVIIGRFTRSVTAYLQMSGRAGRTDPANPAKEAVVLDCGGASHYLGLPDEPREWSLEDGEIHLDIERRKPRPRVRECAVCMTSYRKPPCPHCGAMPTMAEVEQVATDLVAAKPAKERAAKTSKGARARASAAAIRADTDAEAEKILREFNVANGYKPNYKLFWVLQTRRRL